jgi:hypothetical protein
MSLHICICWDILAQEDCLPWTWAVKFKSHNRDCWTPAAERPWTLWKYFSVWWTEVLFWNMGRLFLDIIIQFLQIMFTTYPFPPPIDSLQGWHWSAFALWPFYRILCKWCLLHSCISVVSQCLFIGSFDSHLASWKDVLGGKILLC